jgi:hypothetical protein
MNEVSPLIISHAGKEIAVSTDPKVMQFTSEYFKKNSPDMSQYFLKEWTDHEYEKVAEFIKAIVPYKQIIDNLVANTKDERMKKHFTNSAPVNRSQAPMGESLEYTPAAPAVASSNMSIDLEDDFGSITESPAPVKSAPAAPAKADDLDDLFADL